MKKVMIMAGMVAALGLGGQAAAADGKAVFDKTCKGCHTAMKPKMGDKATWAPLIAQGADALTAVVMKGKKPMPPKGGAKDEAEVKAAVEYMIDQNK